MFPINRRHQGLATLQARINDEIMTGFQSIGVTKDWRHLFMPHPDGYGLILVSNQ